MSRFSAWEITSLLRPNLAMGAAAVRSLDLTLIPFRLTPYL
jgi:hypothetical protein